MKVAPDSHEGGFTLIELLVVVAIVGILSSIALPQMSVYRRKAEIARTAAEMRGFASAFVAYTSDSGDYPPDSHLIVPPGMAKFIATGAWLSETPIGGRYNWEGPDGYPYAGVSISDCPASNEDLETLDRMLDNGDLATGRMRLGANGRPTLIIEDNI